MDRRNRFNLYGRPCAVVERPLLIQAATRQKQLSGHRVDVLTRVYKLRQYSRRRCSASASGCGARRASWPSCVRNSVRCLTAGCVGNGRGLATATSGGPIWLAGPPSRSGQPCPSLVVPPALTVLVLAFVCSPRRPVWTSGRLSSRARLRRFCHDVV